MLYIDKIIMVILMRTISLCMIVRDEEDVLERCLDSVKDLVDEIVIVDTGSVDKTKEIAMKYTKNVYDFEWVDDFAEARNFSFSKATKDYIMWLDADDVIEEEERERFLELKKNIDYSVDIYMLKYKVDQDTVLNRERLLKRSANFKWVSPIHEVIIPTGNIKYSDVMITHKKEKIKDLNRNLNIFRKMLDEGIEFDDRQEYCYAKELYYLNRTQEAIDAYERYINKHIKENNQYSGYLYEAIIELSDCYKRKVERDKEFDTLCLILRKQIPKPDCLNKIGDIFLREEKYHVAIYWFEQALEMLESSMELNSKEYFISYISLGICYYWLGDIDKAIRYNEKAGEMKENDEMYLRNKDIYLERIKNANKKS